MHTLDRFDGSKNWRQLVENQWFIRCWSMSLGFSGQEETSHMTKHDKTDNAWQCMTMHYKATARDLLIQMQHGRCTSCLRAIEWDPEDGPWHAKQKKDGSSLIQLDFTLDLSGSRMVQELIFCILRQSSPWQVAEHLTHLQHFASLPIANWKMLESALCVLWCSARECANQGN
jgi:hypothetical protein